MYECMYIKSFVCVFWWAPPTGKKVFEVRLMIDEVFSLLLLLLLLVVCYVAMIDDMMLREDNVEIIY